MSPHARVLERSSCVNGAGRPERTAEAHRRQGPTRSSQAVAVTGRSLAPWRVCAARLSSDLTQEEFDSLFGLVYGQWEVNVTTWYRNSLQFVGAAAVEPAAHEG
jgi:hypothetical protein